MKTKEEQIKEYFILKDENEIRPFAIIIVGKNSNLELEEKIISTVAEEYSYNKVELGSILLPDFGDSDFFNAYCVDDDGHEVRHIIEITKVVAY